MKFISSLQEERLVLINEIQIARGVCGNAFSIADKAAKCFHKLASRLEDTSFTCMRLAVSTAFP